MFSTFVGELKGYFGKAFVLAAWLPVFLFASLSLVVYLLGSASLEVVWQHWRSLQLNEQIVLAIAFVAPVTLVAFVIHYLQVPITRFFEGYWEGWPGLRTIGRWKREQHQRQAQTLHERLGRLGEGILRLEQGSQSAVSLSVEYNRLAQRRLNSFPPPGDEKHFMPTRLGNIYKAAELYPYHRYGADSVILWPRLRQVLPDGFVERLQELKIAIDFLLLLSLLAVLFALLAVPYLAWQGTGLLVIAICALGLPVGWLAYRAALSPALAYAELIKVAYDLYRHALLKSLGLNVPATRGQEQKLWGSISDFVLRNLQPDEPWRYTFKPS